MRTVMHPRDASPIITRSAHVIHVLNLFAMALWLWLQQWLWSVLPPRGRPRPVFFSYRHVEGLFSCILHAPLERAGLAAACISVCRDSTPRKVHNLSRGTCPYHHTSPARPSQAQCRPSLLSSRPTTRSVSVTLQNPLLTCLWRQ